jgi:hypothetical protein
VPGVRLSFRLSAVVLLTLSVSCKSGLTCGEAFARYDEALRELETTCTQDADCTAVQTSIRCPKGNRSFSSCGPQPVNVESARDFSLQALEEELCEPDSENMGCSQTPLCQPHGPRILCDEGHCAYSEQADG